MERKRKKPAISTNPPVKADHPLNHLADLLYGGPSALPGHPTGLLNERGISVAKFAESVGVSRQIFYRYLGGVSSPSPDTADRIIAELGIPRKVFEIYCTPYER